MENRKISCDYIQDLKNDFEFYYDNSIYGLINKRKEIFNINYNGMKNTYSKLINIENNYIPKRDIDSKSLEDKIEYISLKEKEILGTEDKQLILIADRKV